MPSDYFRALRGDTVSLSAEATANVATRQTEFTAIFSALEGAGATRAELVEAFAFHTGSGENLWGEMVRIRDEGLSHIATTQACTITSSPAAAA